MRVHATQSAPLPSPTRWRPQHALMEKLYGDPGPYRRRSTDEAGGPTKEDQCEALGSVFHECLAFNNLRSGACSAFFDAFESCKAELKGSTAAH
jgi:hypothetical protein